MESVVNWAWEGLTGCARALQDFGSAAGERARWMEDRDRDTPIARRDLVLGVTLFPYLLSSFPSSARHGERQPHRL